MYSSIPSRLQPPREEKALEKQVSCWACSSDDVLISRSAKLACSHRVYHSCLRDTFRKSISDRAYMPPKCCTSNPIPLKHVDRLFDSRFKKTLNRKSQEFNTHDSIYCPAHDCGEWIKQMYITVEDRGRKVGKCQHCDTRVCCTCKSKMHSSRDCPTEVTLESPEPENQRQREPTRTKVTGDNSGANIDPRPTLKVQTSVRCARRDSNNSRSHQRSATK